MMDFLKIRCQDIISSKVLQVEHSYVAVAIGLYKEDNTVGICIWVHYESQQKTTIC